MKDRSDDPSHHKWTLLPRSYRLVKDNCVWKKTGERISPISRVVVSVVISCIDCSFCTQIMICFLILISVGLSGECFYFLTGGTGRSSKVERPLMVRWFVWSIPLRGPIELFLVPASPPRLVYQRSWYVLSFLWYGAYKGARCSSVVRAFAHGAMGRRIDPS